jgi:hypothetical protein
MTAYYRPLQYFLVTLLIWNSVASIDFGQGCISPDRYGAVSGRIIHGQDSFFEGHFIGDLDCCCCSRCKCASNPCNDRGPISVFFNPADDEPGKRCRAGSRAAKGSSAWTQGTPACPQASQEAAPVAQISSQTCKPWTSPQAQASQIPARQLCAPLSVHHSVRLLLFLPVRPLLWLVTVPQMASQMCTEMGIQ